MLGEKINNEYPFISKYFEAALKGRLNHAYMLCGSDSLAQYHLAAQIARILNCQNHSGSENCNCTSCSWVKQNRHPALITISPVDYTYANKDSKSSTVITVNQARYLRNELATSSPYHRVIIFTDAVEGKEFESKADEYWKDYRHILPPPPVEDGAERLSWIPMPISYKIFQTEAANSLLKTLEEPSPNITFFFLTRDVEDMIDTIVSRCQVIPVPARIIKKTGIKHIESLLDHLPPKDSSAAILLSEKLIEISKQESCSFEDLLDSMQEYFRRLINANLENQTAVKKLFTIINKIENAKSQLVSYVNAQAVLDSLFLSMI